MPCVSSRPIPDWPGVSKLLAFVLPDVEPSVPNNEQLLALNADSKLIVADA